ncbi:MAG: aldo/keto reductase, partial [Tsuneonella sp.]
MQPADQADRLAIELAGAQRLALGTMGLAGVYGPIPREVAQRTIRAALDAGVTLFDTAPLYGDGMAECLLGTELAGQAAAVVTKFGLGAGRDGRLIRDSHPASVRRSVETSLRRLRRDRDDVLLQHRPDPNVDDADDAGVLTLLVE